MFKICIFECWFDFCRWSDFLQILKICTVVLISVILILHHYRVGCFPFEQFFHVEWWDFLYFSIPKLIPISLLNLLTIFITDASWLLFAAKSLRSSISKRCKIIHLGNYFYIQCCLCSVAKRMEVKIGWRVILTGYLLERWRYWLKMVSFNLSILTIEMLWRFPVIHCFFW